MKRIFGISLLSLLLVIFIGCAAVGVSLNDETVHSYFNEKDIPEDVTFVYSDDNGTEWLRYIYDNASIKMISSWVELNDCCRMNGKYDGIWYYGWGSPGRLLVAYGENKDEVYELMQGYEKFNKDLSE